SWNVGASVQDMSYMFAEASSFNQSLQNWDMGNVIYLEGMFSKATSYNQPLSLWNTSSVTETDGMFNNATAFDQDLSAWQIGQVTNMSLMFSGSGLSNENYEKTLIGWSELPSLQNGVPLDAPQNFYCEAKEARQKLIDDYGWTINDAGESEGCSNTSDFALRINTGGTATTYDDHEFVADTYYDTGNTLDRPQTGLPEPYQTFRFSRSQVMGYDIPLENGEYTVKLHFAELWFGATGGGSGGVGSRVFDVSIEGQLAEDNLDIYAEVGADAMLIKTHTVTVTDGHLNIDFDAGNAVGGVRHPVINAIEILGDITEPEPRPFVTTWKTDNPGTSRDNQITIPTYPDEAYDYTIDWGDGTLSENVTGDITHTYAAPGTYRVSISGDFPGINFNTPEADKGKIRFINQWGDIVWRNMRSSYWGCSNLDVPATDVPNLSNVSTLNGTFVNCVSLVGNESFNNWDLDTIVEIENLFAGASKFNQPLDLWDVSNVIDMTATFSRASSFNQPIGNWDVGKVEEMWAMFDNATAFNQDIGNWDVSNVLSYTGMFANAVSFDQDLGGWDVSGASDFDFMFSGATLSQENYDKILIGWSQNPSLQNGVTFHGGHSQFCLGEEARQKLMDDYNWTITDGGKASDCDTTTDFALRINTGGTATTYDGNEYVTDTYFDTGNTLDRPQTGLPEPYQTFRFSRSQVMGYDIPLENGEYTVKLHFAELWFGATGGGSGGVGSRVFDVNLEGQLAEDNLDIFAEVGADAMLVKTHTVTVTDGVLNIDFDARDEVGGERHPVINAIEILGSDGNSGKGYVVKGAQDNQMDLYPNQAGTYVQAEFDTPVRAQRIMVFDIAGRLVRIYVPKNVEMGAGYRLDVSRYGAGTYILNIVDDTGASHQEQMVVKH
ncbi:MAG: BspA family leucine-rich repeat surface protein, partial [Flavobacteriaceae bacterium]